MSPPVRKGGIASSSARLPYRKPIPVGAHILWPLAARKSTSSACTSTGMCGTDCAASTSTSAPAACARGTIVSSGTIEPIVLETWVSATSLTPRSSASRSSSTSVPSARGGDEAQLGAGLGGQQLPRHEVGVVLELAGEDRVAGVQVLQAPRERDQVDRLGRVAGPDDLGALARVDEARHLRAGGLEGVGRAGRDLVHAAVDVGVVVLVVVDQALDHRARLLRAGRRVEVHQPLAARRRLGQDRKVGLDAALLGRILARRAVLARGIPGQHVQLHASISVASSILWSSAVRTSSRSASPGKREMAGSKKASAIIRTAWARAMPRLPT